MSFSCQSVEPAFFVDGYSFFFNRKNSQELKSKPLTRHLYCNRLRKIHSKGAIIVLLWVFLVWCSVNFVGEFADKLRLQIVGPKLLNRHNNIDVTLLGKEIPLHYGYYATIGAIWLLGTPLVGWLADVHFGRQKVMVVSLWVMWCGVVVHSYLYLAHNHDQSLNKLSTWECLTSFSALIVYMCGLVGFLINSVQFGMDQMPDASSLELSAFVHWYVFALSAGIWLSQLVLGLLMSCPISKQQGGELEGTLSTAEITVLTLSPTLLLSLALLSDSYLRHCLIIEPHSKNPIKLVAGVLKYVAKHSKPTNPSAYVYTLKTIPNRFDYAKNHFGGPYTTEQVEDVKTFLRILLLMSPGILVLTGTLLTSFNLTEFEDHLKSRSIVSECRKVCLRFFVYDYRLYIMLFIVVHEFLINPLLVKFYYLCCKTLRRIFIGTLVGLALSFVLAVFEIIGHTKSNPPSSCMFLIDSAKNISFLNIEYLPVVVPINIIVAVQTILFISGAWEFICAQAPYSMRGLLIGAVWATLAIATILTNVITIGWYFGSNKHPHEYGIVRDVGCGGFYFLTVFLISLLGLILYGLAVCWYRPRMREETEDQRLLVEEIYAKEVKAAAASSVNTTTHPVSENNSSFMLGVTCTVSTIQ